MKKLLCIVALFCILTTSTHAAGVSLSVPQTIHTGQVFAVTVHIGTDAIPVNAVDIQVAYPKGLVSFTGYTDNASIKKLWVIHPSDISGMIHFSGIVPGGIDGTYDPHQLGLGDINFVQLLFRANSEGMGEFVIRHSDILKNDGLGTPLTHRDSGAFIKVSEQVVLPENVKDTVPPEQFITQYLEVGAVPRTSSMITFFATDEGSGIEKYQIRSGNNTWNDATSPLKVTRGFLKRSVYIKAIDFNGNEKINAVEIPGLLSIPQLIGTIAALFGLIVFVGVKRKKRYTNTS